MKLVESFNDVLQMINAAKERSVLAVNSELIGLYWNIGKYISDKVNNSDWGNRIVANLSDYINKNAPETRGFSSQNLWRMKQFYETYVDTPKLSSLLREISWTNNLMIFSKAKTNEEREFYLKLTAKEKYTSRELERQIDSGLFERLIISDRKISSVLREIHPKSIDAFRDNYILDFLSLPKPFSEKDLRKSIIQNLKTFLLEFGKDFSFVGEEYRVQVGTKDFFVDLLFYHRDLQCLVAFDLKITDFKPEYLGKMEFYLESLDRDIKKEHEKPSVGVILCKSKDSKVVEYALSRSMSPAMIAKYETELIDKNLLEKKLEEFFQLAEKSKTEE